MTATITIPYHLLIAVDAINARGTSGKDGLDELAASIAAKGLIQPLAVREQRGSFRGDGSARSGDAPNGFYEIIDGRRRYQALTRLVKRKVLPRDHPVPVLVRDDADDAAALETSLLANTQRLPMHPVDQHAVFARLADHGLAAADIAARFGLAEKTVRQHLALGRLAPEIREAWRKGKIDARTAQAFTLADSRELQVDVWNRLKRAAGGVQEYYVRSALVKDRPRADRVAPALMAAYLAAGGTVSESLFEEERYIDDGALLRTVAADHAETERQRLLAEGWSWVAFADDLPPEWKWEWEMLGRGVEPVYTPQEERRLEELEAIPYDDAAEAEREAIEGAATARLFTPEMRARSGAVIEVYAHGATEIAYGVVRPGEAAPEWGPPEPDDEEPPPPGGEGQGVGGTPATAPEDDGPTISNALLEALTTTLTLAAQRALPADPLVAMRAAVAALETPNWSTPVRLHASGYQPQLRDGNFNAAFRSLAALHPEALLARFAVAMTAALDLRRHNVHADRAPAETLRDALPAEAYLAAARELFNAADYFARAPKALAEAALEEMGVAIAAGGKKAELAAYAAQCAKEKGWLPPELRHPGYALIAEQPAPAPAKRGRKGRDARQADVRGDRRT